MAGNRHHYIPRFLQKGFCSRKRKKEVYTFVFTKDKLPYEPNVINVGLETDFYGNPEISIADHEITAEEDKHIRFIEDLRSFDSTRTVDPQQSANFVGHMLIRAKHLRGSINEIGTVFIDTLNAGVQEQKKKGNILKSFLKNNRKLAAKSILEKLPNTYTSDQKFTLTKKLLDNPDKWPKELGEVFQNGFVDFLEQFPKKIPEIIKKSHIEILEKETVSKTFLAAVQDHSWKVYYSQKNTFILGDVGVIGSFYPDDKLKPLMFFKNNLKDVFLPISKNHLLVGLSAKSKTPILSPIIINQFSAQLSRSFFISAINTPDLVSLSKTIGTNSCLVQKEDVMELENRVKNEWFGK